MSHRLLLLAYPIQVEPFEEAIRLDPPPVDHGLLEMIYQKHQDLVDQVQSLAYELSGCDIGQSICVHFV